jgi:glutamate-ammonia-ligase adenylyltransferase
VFALFSSTLELPHPAKPDQVENALRDWMALADAGDDPDLSRFMTDFAADASQPVGGRGFLAAIFGNSPFLTRSILRDPEFVRDLATKPLDIVRDGLFAEVARRAAALDVTALMAVLRHAKSRLSLITAAADITASWSLEQVTDALSEFAALSLELGLRHLLRAEADLGNILLDDRDDPCRGSGLAVIGMGKLGARELNYSSDIDLIVLWDQDIVRYVGRKGPEQGFVGITRNLVRLMQERTADGYVFRTDLRLRPDAGATPVALSMAAAENYYESVGQNWERAAMIKARAVAGDIKAGEEFLKRISPFVWRKFLDYAAIENIHSIKRQIHVHKGHAAITVSGHNIKVGRGGIREIEFFAQTQQLIAGGREPGLRSSGTCSALRALAAGGRIGDSVADDMIQSYQFLRQLEHRLQMVSDEQTQTLPNDEAGLTHIALFDGYRDLASFKQDVLRHLGHVQSHYAQLFEDAPALSAANDQIGNLVFTGADDDPETLKTLLEMGFREPVTLVAIVRRWHHGRYRATRSTRARELLTELMPVLLGAMAKMINPDAALLKFDEFLGKLPAGVQLFSLFHANPELLGLVAEIMGDAPRLAEYLSRNVSLLDGVISGGFYDPLPDAAELRRELEGTLGPARGIEDVFDITRRWSHAQRFQVGVQQLRRLVGADQAGLWLSDLADIPIQALLSRVSAELAQRHGVVAGGAFAVIAMGKLGGRELTAGSDLDLTFVYDHPDDVSASDGGRALSVTVYYARLAKRLITALNAMTGEGRLYDIDMRLRPSGAAGPIAVRLDGFRQYQLEEAWTWEHMALVRARVVAGPEAMATKIGNVIQEVLRQKRDAKSILPDVAEMRERIDREKATDNPWSVKHVRGGVVDLEFIAQTFILLNAHKHGEIIDGNTSRAFEKLARAGVIKCTIAKELIEATHLMRDVQGLLRQTTREAFNEEAAPEGLRIALAATTEEGSFEILRDKLMATEEKVFSHYRQFIGMPAARLVESE